MKLKSQVQAAHAIHGTAARLVEWRWPLGLIAAAILAAALPFSQRLQMDRTIDQMFAADDPTLLAYNELRDAFGGNAVVMLVYRDDELMTQEGLDRADEVSERVSRIKGVRGVLSVAQLNELLGVIRLAGLLTGFSSDSPPLLREDDLIARAFERLFVGYTHSDAGDRSAIVALLEPPDVEIGHQKTVASFRRVIEEMPVGVSEAVLVGEPVLLSEGFDLIERDGFRLAVWTLAILSPLVLVLLRGIRWVVLQAAVIGWAVTVTRGLLYLAGLRLSLVSSILTAICTVITVTAIIHLGSMWRKRRSRGDDGTLASRRSISLVMPAIFWACATDAAGFLSLLGSAITPIRDFAVMMGLASLCVWIGIVLMSPLIMTFLVSDRWTIHSRFLSSMERLIRRGSVRFAVVTIRFRVWVAAATILLCAMTFFGLGQLKIETSFLRNFRDDSRIAQEYRIVEAALSGAGVWDVILDAPETLTDNYLRDVREIEKRLREIDINGEQLTKVLSMADADRITAVIPLMRIVSPSVRLAGMRTAIPAFSDALLTPDAAAGRKLRIMLRSREHLDAETKMALIAKVEAVVKKETTTKAWGEHFSDKARSEPGRVTGYYVMIARLVSQIIGDQWRCLIWATAMIWLLLGVATRSLRLATLALIPNLLPVLGVLGVVGWLGQEMNMGAAMIAAVSIGLSIDGSIHYLASYRRKLSRGRSDRDAALYAQRGVGLPVVLATIALMIGFLGLGRSEFVPTATFGILTAAALMLGAAVNLTLLPVLVSFRGRGERMPNQEPKNRAFLTKGKPV